MIDAHLPALQIIVPLIAAPLCILLRKREIVWGFAFLVSLSSVLVASRLLWRVVHDGPIVYALGGWAPPLGIEYRIDLLNGFVLLIVSSIAPLVFLFAPRSLALEINKEKLHLFYAASLLSLTGLLGIIITGDAFNVFVFLEISALSSYVLIGLGRNRRALTSSFQYLVMGTLGGTFILIGIGLLYMKTGTLSMADLAQRLAQVEYDRTIQVSYAFFTVGLGLKMALFPLHFWLPNAYTFAPSVVSAFLAATATKVAVYVFLRFTFTVYDPNFIFETLHLEVILLPISLAAILIGSSVAIYQRNIKRMLAYSSVAQIGYIVLGISFVSLSGLTGSIVHLFNHALMKGALFLAMGCYMLRLRSVHINDLHGIGRSMPWTSFAFVLAGLSLIGVPFTAGFVSKWYLVQGALEKNMWPVAFLIVGSSILAFIYIWRVVEIAYFKSPQEKAVPVREAPVVMLVPMYIMVLANFFFGIETDASAGVAEKAAAFLMDSAQ